LSKLDNKLKGSSNIESFKKNIGKKDLTSLLNNNQEVRTNFLEWTGLRHSVPFDFRNAYHNLNHTALNPSFKIDCGLFDVTKKKSKDYYSLFVRKKACFLNNARKFKCEYNLTDEALKKAFPLPHSVAFEPYVKAFQFKIWNSILSQIPNYTKSGTLQIIYVLSANANQKQCSISFMIALIQFPSGKISKYITYL